MHWEIKNSWDSLFCFLSLFVLCVYLSAWALAVASDSSIFTVMCGLFSCGMWDHLTAA